jgi:hypothetical protein
MRPCRTLRKIFPKTISPYQQQQQKPQQDDFDEIVTREDIEGSSSEEEDGDDEEYLREIKYGLPLRKRKVCNLAAAIDTNNYKALEPVLSERVVRGKISKNTAEDLVFNSKIPTPG